jgi:mono/diheme cytochrome c family protein
MRVVLMVAVTTFLLSCAAPAKEAPKRLRAPKTQTTKILPGDGQRLPGEVQEVFDTACDGCHGNLGRLPLDAKRAYANLVDRPSHQLPKMLRVAPGEPQKSYLMHKMLGTHLEVGGHGTRMPDGGSWGAGGSLTDEDVEVVRAWILQGAPAGK